MIHKHITDEKLNNLIASFENFKDMESMDVGFLSILKELRELRTIVEANRLIAQDKSDV